MLQQSTKEDSRPGLSPRSAVALAPGTLVDQFRVARQVGRGGMGEVYLARDTVLGRKVALKVIRHRARTAQGTQRFLQEARTTARFSHPNIVTIHTVGTHDGYPYLALEFLEGRSLRDRITEGKVGLRESLRVGIAVAEALAEAHRHNVLHLDLKPENVVIARDGRPRVVDFGLSEVVCSVLEDTLDMSSPDQPTLPPEEPPALHRRNLQGTPAYMAPEQWAQEEVGAAADVWALGVMLHELATGRRPYPVDSVKDLLALVTSTDVAPSLEGTPGITPRHAELVRRCLDKRPERRPAATEVADKLRELLAVARGSPTGTPFPGLQHYGEQQARFFCGRDAEIDAFLERLRDVPVLPVVGPSGAGKSSFVRAGVIPRLRDREPWTVITLRPGRRPLRALASCLSHEQSLSSEASLSGTHSTPAGQLPSLAAEQLEVRIRRAPEQLGLLLESIGAARQSRVLLLVDQLEEIFTHEQEAQVAGTFLNAICAAADDPQQPTRVIFTLREDFLGRLAGAPAVRDALRQVTVLGPPGPTALEQILTEPLRALDYGYDDPALVGEMIAAAPASLPLLQFTARALWERRDHKRRLLTRAAYEAMGGVAGAVAAHADAVLEGLPGPALHTVREILLRLVTPERTRRVLTRARLLDGLGPDAGDLLGRLVAARLVAARGSRDASDDHTEVELAHESLISGWSRLSRWIDRSREDLAFLDEMGHAAELWQRRGHRDDDLLQGNSLVEALASLERCRGPVPNRVARFLAAGRLRAERRTRRRRRLTLLVVLLALVLSGIFAYQKHQADTQRRSARQRLAAAQREAARVALGRGDLLEARARVRASLETEDSPLGRALWWRLSKNPRLWRRNLGAVVYGVAFSPDGRHVAAASQDRRVHLFDAETGQSRTLRGFHDQVLSIAFSPAGERIAAGTWSGQVSVRRLNGRGFTLLTGHRDAVRRLAFSPDGRYLASASLDHTLRVWDVDRGITARVLPSPGGAMSVAFSPDGKHLATGGRDGRIQIWTLDRGGEPRRVTGHDGAVTAVAFSPDGQVLASASMDRTVRLWPWRGTGTPTVLRGHSESVSAVCFSPDGTRLASAGYDRAIRVWKRETATRAVTEEVLPGHEGPILGLAFGPRGKRLLSGSRDQTIALWRLGTSREARVLRGHGAQVHGAAFSPDGAVLATGGERGAIRLWDVRTGDQLRTLRGHRARVTALAFSRDGRLLASGSQDRTVRLWNRRDAYKHRVLGSHWEQVYALSFSPDGQLLASGANDTRVMIWDVRLAVLRRVLSGHQYATFGLAFDADSSHLAAAGKDGGVHLWDLASGKETAVLRGHRAAVKGVRFAPGGKQLFTSGDDGTVRLWDLASGKGRVLARGEGRAYFLDVHPGGRVVGVPRSDGSATLICLDHGSPIRLLGHSGEVNRLRFSPDGKLVATTSDDGTARLWRSDDGEPQWRLALMIGSPPVVLTHRGWSRPGSSRAVAPPVGPGLAAAAQQRGRGGDAIPGGRTVCLRVAGEELEIWDRDADRQLQSFALPGLRRVLATDRGCVALDRDTAHIFHDGRPVRRLPASAAAWSGGRLLLASGRAVEVFSAAGQRLERQAVDEGVTAVARVGGRFLVGFGDGAIELLRGGRSGKPLGFGALSSSPVVRLVAGPRHTLIAGHADGTLGLYHLRDGTLLDHSRLHGPVVQLRLHGRRLYAATELGDSVSLDLSTFHLGYCELLRQVWDGVPVLWEHRHGVHRPPPPGHPCRR